MPSASIATTVCGVVTSARLYATPPGYSFQSRMDCGYPVCQTNMAGSIVSIDFASHR